MPVGTGALHSASRAFPGLLEIGAPREKKRRDDPDTAMNAVYLPGPVTNLQ